MTDWRWRWVLWWPHECCSQNTAIIMEVGKETVEWEVYCRLSHGRWNVVQGQDNIFCSWTWLVSTDKANSFGPTWQRTMTLYSWYSIALQNEYPVATERYPVALEPFQSMSPRFSAEKLLSNMTYSRRAVLTWNVRSARTSFWLDSRSRKLFEASAKICLKTVLVPNTS